MFTFNKISAHIRDKWALFLYLAVLAIVFATPANPSAGWLWDIANGFGYAAVACLLAVCVSAPSSCPVRLHQSLSYLCLVLVAFHIGLLLIGDPVSVEYLIPGAPAHMWMGILGGLLLVYLVLSSLPTFKFRVHTDRSGYRFWHRALAWVCVGATLYHIVASGLYLNRVWQALLLLAASGVMLWRPWQTQRLSVSRLGRIAVLSLLYILVFAGLRWWL